MTDLEKCIGGLLACLLTVATVILVMASVGLLMAFPIKWTWNVTMPYLFELPVLTWGKAWCLSFLCGCLINRGSWTKGSRTEKK